MERPLILVTNDDGFTAKGIKSLINAVSEFGDLLIVAPDKPQSGMGHAITVNEPLRVSLSDYFKGHKNVHLFGYSRRLHQNGGLQIKR